MARGTQHFIRYFRLVAGLADREGEGMQEQRLPLARGGDDGQSEQLVKCVLSGSCHLCDSNEPKYGHLCADILFVDGR